MPKQVPPYFSSDKLQIPGKTFDDVLDKYFNCDDVSNQKDNESWGLIG